MSGKRRSHRSGRAPLPSPGRPPVAGRAELQRFWLGISRGMTSEEAAIAAGISQPVGARLFRKAGGMPPAMFRFSAKPHCGATCPWWSAKRSPFLGCKAIPYSRLDVASAGPLRRSPVKCGAKRPMAQGIRSSVERLASRMASGSRWVRPPGMGRTLHWRFGRRCVRHLSQLAVKPPNMPLLLARFSVGTGWMTSQCSTIMPPSMRNRS